MNCAELQRFLPDIMEGDRTPEQAAHLRSCSICSGLVSDLDVISQQAGLLRSSEDPSPRLWNSIEVALREEGLIREPRRGLELVPAPAHHWRPVWLMPVAAALLITAGVVRYKRGSDYRQVATAPVTAANLEAKAQVPASHDEQWLTDVSDTSPATRIAYESDLRHVNAYIKDAEQSVRNHPNDEEAQRYLMNAYEQKAMVYDLAFERAGQ